MTDSEFLTWVADRLVHVHGDPEHIDFVLKLRRMAAVLPQEAGAPPSEPGTCPVCSAKDFAHRVGCSGASRAPSEAAPREPWAIVSPGDDTYYVTDNVVTAKHGPFTEAIATAVRDALNREAGSPAFREAPPDWLRKIAAEMPFLADYLLTENGRVGWDLTVRQWAERLQEYVAGGAFPAGACQHVVRNPAPGEDGRCLKCGEAIY